MQSIGSKGHAVGCFPVFDPETVSATAISDRKMHVPAVPQQLSSVRRSIGVCFLANVRLALRQERQVTAIRQMNAQHSPEEILALYPRRIQWPANGCAAAARTPSMRRYTRHRAAQMRARASLPSLPCTAKFRRARLFDGYSRRIRSYLWLPAKIPSSDPCWLLIKRSDLQSLQAKS